MARQASHSPTEDAYAALVYVEMQAAGFAVEIVRK